MWFVIAIREKRDSCFSDLKVSEMIFDTERIVEKKFICSLKFERTAMSGVGGGTRRQDGAKVV